MSTKVESSQRQIEWRRNKVAELDSQGHSQPEIARILQISIGTVNRDLSILRQQAKENIKRYIDERLPEEYEKCLVGLTAITKGKGITKIVSKVCYKIISRNRSWSIYFKEHSSCCWQQEDLGL